MVKVTFTYNLRLAGLFSFALFVPFIYAAPTSTSSTQIPASISCTPKGDGSKSVCCRHAIWTDFLIFYTTNYLAHAATTRTRPGQSLYGTACAVIMACLFPMSGTLRGVRAILSRAKFAKSDLQMAARAGALCMVVKVAGTKRTRRHMSDKRLTQVHGSCMLPPEYVLMTVPRNATFFEDQVSAGKQPAITLTTAQSAVNGAETKSETATSIACSYSLAKALVAVLQALFVVNTLYATKGSQIDRFGYAAFGLTIVPYAVTTVVNLIANVICPEYPAMYVVSNQTLRDLQRQHGQGTQAAVREKQAGQSDTSDDQADLSADNQDQTDQVQPLPMNWPNQRCEVTGVVGTLSSESDKTIRNHLQEQITNATFRGEVDIRQLNADPGDREFKGGFYLFFGIVAAILAIIGGLSRFHKASSTVSQRVLTMMWLSFGILFGSLTERFVEDTLESRGVLQMRTYLPARSYWKKFRKVFKEVVGIAIASVPAIGGMVVVGQMIAAYGVCNLV